MADGVPFVEGVDHTGGANIAALVAAGKQFACRYGGPGGAWKHITPTEAQALSAAGVAIVANAEGSASGLLGGWSAGVSWARDAEAHFAACGMPSTRPIYFSVDFNVSSGQWAAVASALRGAASVVGAGRVGVYGGRRAIEWARRDGVAQWFWQTYAWSSGVWVPGNHIEQYRNGVALAGGTLDLDRALATDFGQWTTTGADMDADEIAALRNVNGATFALLTDAPTYLAHPANRLDYPAVEVRNKMHDRLTTLAADVAELKTRPAVQPAPVDPAVVASAVKAALTDPEVLAGIARAVADEDHRRSQE